VGVGAVVFLLGFGVGGCGACDLVGLGERLSGFGVGFGVGDISAFFKTSVL
jgi:hypothetical protein